MEMCEGRGGVLAVGLWLGRLNKNPPHTELRQTMLMIEVKHFDSLTQLSVKHLRKRKIGLKKNNKSTTKYKQEPKRNGLKAAQKLFKA